MSENEDGTGGENNEAASWRDSLPETMRGDAYFNRFETLDAFAESALNAQNLIGRKGVIAPQEGDGPEVVAEFRKAIGVPDSVDGYTRDALAGAFGGPAADALTLLAHEAGISSDAWGKIEPALAGAEVARRDGARNAGAESMAALKEKWGAAFDERFDVANRAAHELFGEAAESIVGKALENGTTIGTDSDFIQRLYEVGNRIAEGQINNPEAGRGTVSMTPDDAGAAYRSLIADPEKVKILMNPAHPEHRDLDAQRSRLFKLSIAGQAA